MQIKRILVPVDFSAPALKALDYAVEFSKQLKARVHVVFVIEPITYATPADFYAGAATQVSTLILEQRRAAVDQLNQLGKRFKKKGIDLRTELRSGIAYQEIVACAKGIKADMIIHATHGRTGLSHLLMGSVAERVLRTAPCPVLTLRSEVAKKAVKKKARRR
jgi:nucleotide-binding universal stress UspA family protein